MKRPITECSDFEDFVGRSERVYDCTRRATTDQKLIKHAFASGLTLRIEVYVISGPDTPLTYEAPADVPIQPGSLVKVPLGKRQLIGIVIRILNQDEVVPFWHGENLFMALPQEWRAKPFWVEGAGHNNIEALLRPTGAFVDKLNEFLDLHIGARRGRIAPPARVPECVPVALREMGSSLATRSQESLV